MPRRAPFRVYMDRYLERLRSRSPATRATYRKWLRELETTARSIGLTTTPVRWTLEDVEMLVEARALRLDGIPRANTTVRSEMGLLNRFLKSMGNYSMDRAMEYGDLRMPPDTRPYRRWKSLEDIIILRATAMEVKDHTALITMQLALDAYLRVSEIASLEMVDVRGTAIQVRRGKGRKDRVVAITERTALDIARYVSGPRVETLAGKTHPRLVVHTSRGAPSGYRPTSLSHRVRTIGQACGVAVSPHDLRRTGAQLTYIASPTEQTVRDLQSALGHSTTEQTRDYIGAAVVDQHKTLAIRDRYLQKMYPEEFSQSAAARY